MTDTDLMRQDDANMASPGIIVNDNEDELDVAAASAQRSNPFSMTQKFAPS